MKKHLLLFTLILFMGFTQVGWGQLLNENVNYTIGTALTANGWTAHSSGGTNPINVSASSITYSGYLSSGIGGEVTLTTSGEDINKTFTSQTTGTVYASCLVKITSATTAGDYFFHLGPSTIGTTFFGRVFVKKDASNNLAFGISRGGAAATAIFTPLSYALNTTYLLILKYTVVSGTTNDISAIYINPALNDVEPATGWTTSTDAATDAANIGSIALRQGGSSTAAAMKVDGIRIATTWSDIVGLVPPTTQSYSITFSSVAQTQMDVSWTNGDGSKRVVIINTSNSFTNPTNGTDPTANTVYAGSGEQVVYNNTGSSVTVTGLTANTTYWYRVYDYNGTSSATSYFTATATGNPNSQATASAGTASINITNSMTSFGNVVSGATSDVQSYSVAGTTLSNDIVITAPAGFEISESNSPFSSSSPITLTQSGGSVGSTTIYVRFVPSSADGSYSSALTHVSDPATQQDITLTGVAIASEPTTQSSITFGTVTSTSVVVNFSGGNGTNKIVLAKSGNAVDGTPTDATLYSASATFSSGTQIGTGNYVVYDGTASTVTVTGLSANTTYYFAVYDYNIGTNTSQNYYTTSPGTNSTLTQANIPTASAATTFTITSFYANWSSVTEATSYKLDVSTDNFSTFVSGYDNLDVGLVTTYNVTGLSVGTSYSYRVRAANATGSSDNSGTITTSTLATAPTTQASSIVISAVGNNQFDISWTKGDGANSIVLVKASSTVNSDPVNGTSYTANATFKSGSQIGTGNYVVYNTTSNSVTVTGLTQGTTYYVSVYEFNGSAGNENYLTTSPATNNQLTSGSSVASHVVIAEIYGGGGNSGAPYTNDYIVLYNPTASSVDVSSWSVQYASNTGSFSTNITNLTGTIAADGYYLIQEAAGGTPSADLPVTPNVIGGISMAATGGKVALASIQTAISGVGDLNVVDFVGYGSATTFEGTAATSAPSNTSSVRRKSNVGTNAYGSGNGYDLNDNSLDFYVESDLVTNAPLPVELTSFSATTQNRAVNLTWKTATEVNNFGFEVERVKDFGDKVSMVSVWEKVGFVNGAGNSNSPKEYSFTDKSAASGKYLYRLKQLDNDGQYSYSKEVEVDLGTPTAFALEQNYPNPFNPTTSMQYSVSSKQFVTIKVFDMLGREVALLVNGEKEPGTYTTEFATTGLASGTYIYRMQAGEFVQTKKMIVLK